jgi:hypothetical protein
MDRPGDWGIIFETPNLRDILAIAQAKFLTAQADQMGAIAGGKEIQNSKFKIQNSNGVIASETKQSYCSCGAKEFQRPTPWPELDKVENEYETTLKDRGEELQDKVFLILKLPQEKSVIASETKQSKNEIATATPRNDKAPSDIPSIETFTFSEVQRAQIMQAYKDWFGTFDIEDENSAIKWYYGQAYSLGLIQAAKLIGKDRPILDIIKNQEIYDELCKNGFQFVKDNATTAITNEILPAMQAHMLAGSNPLQVASVLKKLFGDQNSDWERLARSEISMAAEKAKLDEWAEWKVKRVEFKPAPDACPICIAVAGDYDIGECPIPVEDTHPRCRCSIRPAESEA